MKVIEIINDTIKEKRTRFTVEMLPPLKGEGTDGMFEAIDIIAKYNPAYINITNHREIAKFIKHPNGLLEKHLYRQRPGTIGISSAIKQKYGIEIVPHIIAAAKSRYDIEDDLIDLDFLGIKNVLALRGDNVSGEKFFKTHENGHTHASELVAQITQMNGGNFLDSDNPNEPHRTDFCVGVAGYPEKHAEAPNLEQDIEYLKHKVACGAQYIVTQMSFNTQLIIDFTTRCRAVGIDVPIVAGIKPLTMKRQLTMLPQTFNVDLPQELVCEVAKCKDDREVKEVGIEWAIMQSKELIKAGVPIIHFYTMSKTNALTRIIEVLF